MMHRLHRLVPVACVCAALAHLPGCSGDPAAPPPPPPPDAHAWQWQHPRPQGEPILGICGVGPSVAVGVGEAGAIVRTDDGGATWRAQPTGTRHVFWDVGFADSRRGTAVGFDGAMVHTDNAGVTWRSRSSGTDQDLWGVRYRDRDVGIVVGNGTILRTDDGGRTWTVASGVSSVDLFAVDFVGAGRTIAVGGEGAMMWSDDDGRNWRPSESGTKDLLMAVDFYDAANGAVFGDDGLVMITSDGGVSWQRSATGYDHRLLSGVMPGRREIVAGGADGSILRTVDGGATWSIVPSGLQQVMSMSRAGGDVILAAGRSVVRSVDRGRSWQPILPWTTAALHDVAYLDERTGIAVGDSGMVYRTDDGGAGWTRIEAGTQATLHAVAMRAGAVAFIAGGAGTLLRSDDGGMHWQPLDSGTAVNLHGIAFCGPDTGYAAGDKGAVLRTVDGGATWQQIPVSGMIYDFYDVVMPSAGRVIVCGELGYIWYSDDGGEYWRLWVNHLITHQDLHAMVFLDSTRGFVVGSGDPATILSTADGGANWLPFEVAWVPPAGSERVGAYARDLALGPGGVGVMCTFGGVYLSDDGCRTWAYEDAGSSAGIRGAHIAQDGDCTLVGTNTAILGRNVLD